MSRLRNVLAAAAMTAAATAHGNPTLPGGATIAFGTLDKPTGDPAHYFNLAHCACGQAGAAPPAYMEGTFAYRLLLQGATTPVHRPLDIWVGTGCDVAATRATKCTQITSATVSDLSTIPAAGLAPEVGVYDLMEPDAVTAGCDMRALASAEWAIADGDGDGVYDYFASHPIATDALPPPLPTDYSLNGGKGFIELAWTPPPDTSDIVAYQALCAAGVNPASTLAPPAPLYITGRQLCGLGLDVPLRPAKIEGVRGNNTLDANEEVDIPQGIAQLDPTFLCGETTDPTASSLRIDGLPDATSMVVLLLAIDAAGNASAQYFYPPLTTRPPNTNAGCCEAAGGDPASALLAVLVLFQLRMGRGTRSCRRSASSGS